MDYHAVLHVRVMLAHARPNKLISLSLATHYYIKFDSSAMHEEGVKMIKKIEPVSDNLLLHNSYCVSVAFGMYILFII